jgi:hypothetical protein
LQLTAKQNLHGYVNSASAVKKTKLKYLKQTGCAMKRFRALLSEGKT